jgi:hypothetical protein
MVIRPFTRWSGDHAARISGSQDELTGLVKTYDRQVAECRKLRQTYYNKCRLVEDLEEETNLAFPTAPTAEEKGKGKEVAKEEEEAPKSPPTRRSTIDEGDEWPVEIGDQFYGKDQLSEMLSTMIKEIPRKEVKVCCPLYLLSVGSYSRHVQKLLNGSRHRSLVDICRRPNDSLLR